MVNNIYMLVIIKVNEYYFIGLYVINKYYIKFIYVGFNIVFLNDV